MAYGFIYMTTNNLNGVRYIGQHTKFNDNYLGSGLLLSKAVKKYGSENFSREVLKYCETKEELDQSEKDFIKKFNAVEDPMFYNIAEGGGSINFWKGKQFDEEHRQNLSLSCKKASDSSKEKSRESLKGMFAGEKNPMYGKKGPSSVEIEVLDSEGNVIKLFPSKTRTIDWIFEQGETRNKKIRSIILAKHLESSELWLGQFRFRVKL